MPRTRLLALTTLILSGAIIVTGAVIVSISSQAPVSFGFVGGVSVFDTLFSPGGYAFVAPLELVGALVIVLGLVGTAGCAGFMLGRRAPQRPGTEPV
ncbi:hypothetical protein [Agromyces sp. Leaf222]|uniref:hypothetical protein n=1 Tax=Agromyces sp. Leaf222 TaxID=1735688 RepID=UPI0006F98CC2|nr:hypothetical protein [Agromyces sp. Leaf222]KQM82676.1 hypothetical protein ASE68_04825 [Agromyces sp. Leaf222]